MAKLIYKTYCPNCRIGFPDWEIPSVKNTQEYRIGSIWNLPIIAKLIRTCPACSFIFEGIPVIVEDKKNLELGPFFARIRQIEFE